MIKLSDYVIEFLAQQGVGHVFGLTGGAVVHLFDSASRNPNIVPIFNHHEQAAAFAAEAYAKINGRMGACFCTTGPGVTNTLTGLTAAWLDSVPCVFISGQTRLAHTTHGLQIRQLGTQQLDVLPIVKSLTKYSVILEDAKEIRYCLEKAAWIARNGRPGPVWIDIPLDLQWAQINPALLSGFDPVAEGLAQECKAKADQVHMVLELIYSASRPLVLLGSGVRLGGADEQALKFIERFQLPFITTWGACDIIDGASSLNLGRPGVAGQRGSNLAIQNCDLLISLGSHLCIPVTGTNYKAFARAAKRIVIDIDDAELRHETVRVDYPILSDVKTFLQDLLELSSKTVVKEVDRSFWKQKCKNYRSYNFLPAERFIRSDEDLVDQYVFIDILSDILSSDDKIVVDGGGTNVYISYQAMRLKKGQRMILSTATCSMGSGLPEAIGVAFASSSGNVICLCGDGSMQLNIQELQTILHHRLPIKIFVFNNDGYTSIRQTQSQFLQNNYCGSEAGGGVSLPNFTAIASAYGLQTYQIRNHSEIEAIVTTALDYSGPALCEVLVPREQPVIPSQGFIKMPDGTGRPRPLEDMEPLLSREEFLDNMIVEPWKYD